MLLLAACGSRDTPAILNTAPEKHRGLPCGVAQVGELRAYGEPRCEPDGSCYPGAALSQVGTCTVGPSGTFDRDGGRKRNTIFEDGVPILSSDAPPSARVVVFDPRVPTPHGIRVGMTGTDLERMFPDQELTCHDDVAWRGRVLCGVRKDRECGAEDANWHLVIFDGAPTLGLDARAAVRARRIIAVDLGPDCGDS